MEFLPERPFLKGTVSQFPIKNWLERQMKAWVRRESDHDIIDSIGIAETIALAKARFSAVIIDYLNFWSASTDHNSDEFRHWSIGIAESVAREIGDLWRKDQWHTSWFERACHKKIDEALLPLTREWECRASKLEIQGLESPHLSIESLLVAKGNLNVASTLEKSKRTMETAQQFLSSLQATEPLNQAKAGQHERAGLHESHRGGDLVPEPSRVARVSCVSPTQPVRDTARELDAIKRPGLQQLDAVPLRSEEQTATAEPESIVLNESVYERSKDGALW